MSCEKAQEYHANSLIILIILINTSCHLLYAQVAPYFFLLHRALAGIALAEPRVRPPSFSLPCPCPTLLSHIWSSTLVLSGR